MFHWKDIYSVNIKEIDQQHHQIIDMINELEMAMKLGRGEQMLDEIYARLVNYTRSHFSLEEKLMREHGFPDYEWHVKEHAHLVAKIEDMEKDRVAGKSGLTIQVLSLLFDWLSHHIMVTDKKYSAYLNERGVR